MIHWSKFILNFQVGCVFKWNLIITFVGRIHLSINFRLVVASIFIYMLFLLLFLITNNDNKSIDSFKHKDNMRRIIDSFRTII